MILKIFTPLYYQILLQVKFGNYKLGLVRTVLSEEEFVNWEDKKNGRFKLYPTDNTYNFIMVDVIDGRTWQVQWNIDYDKRLVFRIW